MPNSNPQAVAFANGYARPVADTLVSAYLTAKRLVQVWNGQNVVAVIPNDANVIVDGSASDGRVPITNAQVNVEIANAIAFIAFFEASASLILNQTLQVSVHAASTVN